jgi:hypothetical protein
LDELERLHRSDPQGCFAGRLDLFRVGIFGHSFGGAVAGVICLTDSRVKAGANLDGWTLGGPATEGFGKPFLYFDSDDPIATPARLQTLTGRARREAEFLVQDERHLREGLARSGGWFLLVRGTTHMDFCDSPFYSSSRRLTHTSPVGGKRVMRIVNAYLLAFFQAQLKGKDELLLAGPSSVYPEVEMERFAAAKPATCLGTDEARAAEKTGENTESNDHSGKGDRHVRAGRNN